MDHMIRRIVDRCHVGDRFPTVLREIKYSMRKGAWQTISRALRRQITRKAISHHKANRELYFLVMKGI